MSRFALPPPRGMQSIAMSVFVCLSTCICQKPHANLTKFCAHLLMAVIGPFLAAFQSGFVDVVMVSHNDERIV